MIDDATINALVAEHVLGMTLRDDESGEPCWYDAAGQYICDANGGDENNRTPDACNSGDVMLNVIEAMRERGFGVYTVSWKDKLIATVEIDDGDRIKQLAHIEANPLPRAVALAALKALGIEIPA